MENYLSERSRRLLDLGLHVKASHDALLAARDYFTPEEIAKMKQGFADMVEVIQSKIER